MKIIWVFDTKFQSASKLIIIVEENGVRWLKMESKIEQRGTRNAWTCLQILSHSVENGCMKNYKALGSNMLRMMGHIWKHWLFHQLYSMRIIFNDHIFCARSEPKRSAPFLNSNHAEIRSFLPIPSPKNIYLWLILLDFFLSFLWPTANGVTGFDDLHYEWSAKGPAAAQATMDPSGGDFYGDLLGTIWWLTG